MTFYLQHGLKLKKVHRAIKFNQANFLKPFIEFNTEKRKQAKNDFEKHLFKLMNNSVYGKTMENVRNHLDYELVSTPERFQQCVNKPTYRNRHIIAEDLVGLKKILQLSNWINLFTWVCQSWIIQKFTCILFTMMS